MDAKKRIKFQFAPSDLTDSEKEVLPLLFTDGSIADVLEEMNEAEQAEFTNMLTEVIEELNKEHTRLMGLMGQTLRMPARQLIWETNHLKITKTINSALTRTGRMPSQAYIAAATGLNRKTVQEHIEQGDRGSVFAEHLQQYNMMAPQVMDVVLTEAVKEHDLKAAKLYFEIKEKMKSGNGANIYNTQNNYIQINNTVIKQEAISHLNPEQLKQIEEILRPGLQVDGDEVRVLGEGES